MHKFHLFWTGFWISLWKGLTSAQTLVEIEDGAELGNKQTSIIILVVASYKESMAVLMPDVSCFAVICCENISISAPTTPLLEIVVKIKSLLILSANQCFPAKYSGHWPHSWHNQKPTCIVAIIIRNNNSLSWMQVFVFEIYVMITPKNVKL